MKKQVKTYITANVCLEKQMWLTGKTNAKPKRITDRH